EVMNQQREVIYGERRRVLHGEDLRDQITGMMHDVIAEYVEGATSSGYAEEWDLDQLWTALGTLYPVAITQDDVIETAGSRSALTADLLRDEITADIEAAYDAREE